MTITLSLGRLQFTFSSTSELRDALLASFVDAGYVGGPRVLVGQDAEPAWSWTAELIRARSDWWPALGIALQHAAHDGGALAQVALADLLANFIESLVLLPWTAPLARHWPDACSTSANTGFGGGKPNVTLAELVEAQQAHLARVAGTATEEYRQRLAREWSRSAEARRWNAAPPPVLDLEPRP